MESSLLKGLYAKDAADPKKRQALYFGEPELEFLSGLAAQALGEGDPERAGKRLDELVAEGKIEAYEKERDGELEVRYSAKADNSITSGPGGYLSSESWRACSACSGP